jgi:uncharacterized protein (DUF2141 family)
MGELVSGTRVALFEGRRPSQQGYNAPMNNRRQPIAFALIAMALSACASAPPEPAEPRPAGQGRVEVTMTGFENGEGNARVALYLDAAGWPDEEGSVFATAVVPISDGHALAVFEEVPAGPFAVSTFHDVDGNGELDSDTLGIPSEDYGFSRDARDLFGPPSFKEAQIELAAGETKQITIWVK